MDALKNTGSTGKTSSTAPTTELNKHVAALLEQFDKWFPEGKAKVVAFADLKLTMPGSMAEWLEHPKGGGTDFGAAMTQLLRNIAQPADRGGVQVLVGDGRGHAMSLNGKAARPPGVPHDKGFDLVVQNLSAAKEKPLTAKAAADGSFNLVIEGAPGDLFSVTGVGPDGQKGTPAIVGPRNPWDDNPPAMVKAR